MPTKAVFPTIRNSRTSQLDRAFHVKRSPLTAVHPEKISNVYDAKMKNDTKKSIPPSERYELWKFEQKYRAFVAADNNGISALVDDVYHDQVVHMMDGVPMNKAALKKLYIDMLNRGTKRTVEKFQVIDGSHVESVIHTRNQQIELYMRSSMTLKEGKIVRVEKIESARATSF